VNDRGFPAKWPQSQPTGAGEKTLAGPHSTSWANFRGFRQAAGTSDQGGHSARIQLANQERRRCEPLELRASIL